MFIIKTKKQTYRVRLDWSVTKSEAKAWFRSNYPEHGKIISVEKK